MSEDWTHGTVWEYSLYKITHSATQVWTIDAAHSAHSVSENTVTNWRLVKRIRPTVSGISGFAFFALMAAVGRRSNTTSHNVHLRSNLSRTPRFSRPLDVRNNADSREIKGMRECPPDSAPRRPGQQDCGRISATRCGIIETCLVSSAVQTACLILVNVQSTRMYNYLHRFTSKRS